MMMMKEKTKPNNSKIKKRFKPLLVEVAKHERLLEGLHEEVHGDVHREVHRGEDNDNDNDDDNDDEDFEELHKGTYSFVCHISNSPNSTTATSDLHFIQLFSPRPSSSASTTPQAHPPQAQPPPSEPPPHLPRFLSHILNL
jgi:hypothetical protein